MTMRTKLSAAVQLTILLLLSPLLVQALPNFAHYQPLSKRKQAFIQYLLPYTLQADKQVLAQRQSIDMLATQWRADHALPRYDRRWLKTIAKQYKVTDWDINRPASWKTLLKRVDIIPPSMVLAQAANESGWGTSRFAREGNNLFGQWCYVNGCGMIPARRNPGATHEVKTFPNVEQSIAIYIQNLNTNVHYRTMRNIRLSLRARSQPLTGNALIAGLAKYSGRGTAYIGSIRTIIKANGLAKYDG
jgi:Bax protein